MAEARNLAESSTAGNAVGDRVLGEEEEATRSHNDFGRMKSELEEMKRFQAQLQAEVDTKRQLLVQVEMKVIGLERRLEGQVTEKRRIAGDADSLIEELERLRQDKQTCSEEAALACARFERQLQDKDREVREKDVELRESFAIVESTAQAMRLKEAELQNLRGELRCLQERKGRQSVVEVDGHIVAGTAVQERKGRQSVVEVAGHIV